MSVSGGRRVIVTGGSSGIGLACARAFVSRGDDVAIIARNAEKLEKAAEQLRSACVHPQQRIEWRSVDLSDWEQTLGAFVSLEEHGFGPDVLVNSAGVIIPGEFASMPVAHLEQNIDCGYWSVVYPCKAVAPGMVERGSGHIVNISSVAGYLGIYGYTGYAAAKYAVMGFTEALRFEMKPAGVKVSVVCPPDTETPGLQAEKLMRPAETDVVAGNIKPIPPEQVAAAVLKAVDTGRYLVIPDNLSAFYFRLKGLLPELFYAIVDGDVAKARKSVSEVESRNSSEQRG